MIALNKMGTVMLRVFVLVGLLGLFVAEGSVAEKVQVELPKLGLIEGRVIETAWTKRKVLQFLDVRYAEPPSGKLRFKPPRPVEPWQGLMDGTKEKISCPSIARLEAIRELDKILDVEDCLTLTITTPSLNGSHPVLVYIHGDYLYEGSNREVPPDYLLEKDIVLVAPQYRLGPFGFLSTKTSEIPGNAGVLDVFLSLQYVKYFIKHFGGDPNRVTLAGQVGGAAIAHLLTISPLVQKGLFHQVIYQSGSSLMPIFLEEDPRQHSKEMAQKVNCSTKSIAKMNQCFMDLPPVELLQAFLQHALEKSDLGVGHTGGIQFTIGGPSHILPKHPYDLMLELNYTLPSMGGCPKNAGTRLLYEIINNDFQGHIPEDGEYSAFDYIDHVIRQSIGTDRTMLLTSLVTHEFFPRHLLENSTFASLVPHLIDVAGTLNHKLPVLLALNMNNKHKPYQTFLYSFDYQGEFNRYKALDDEHNLQSPFKAGVSLTDEALYLFPYPKHVQSLSPADTEMAQRLVELWTNFVIDGHPFSTLRGGHWPAMTNLYGPYLKIDETLSIAGNYFDELTITSQDEKKGHSLLRDFYYLRRQYTDNPGTLQRGARDKQRLWRHNAGTSRKKTRQTTKAKRLSV